jgi:adenine-specific DNA-methyltransferase
MGYRFPEDTMKDLLSREKILFGSDESKIIELKVYAHEFEDKLPSVIQLDGRTAAYELRDIFPEQKKAFDNPKPSQLIERLVSLAASNSAIVLDSFAGSGTTGHAVLAANKRDEGNRRFILVEGEDYADVLTAERVRRVIRGTERLQGLGGEFTYCTLGEPLDLDRILTGETLPSYEAIGAWLFHTATGEAFDPAKMREGESYLGESSAYHVWLVYKPDLDYLKSGQAALTMGLAERIASDPVRRGKRHLVFAPAKYVPNKTLLPMNVEYAPLPYALYRIERE